MLISNFFKSTLLYNFNAPSSPSAAHIHPDAAAHYYFIGRMLGKVASRGVNLSFSISKRHWNIKYGHNTVSAGYV